MSPEQEDASSSPKTESFDSNSASLSPSDTPAQVDAPDGDTSASAGGAWCGEHFLVAVQELVSHVSSAEDTIAELSRGLVQRGELEIAARLGEAGSRLQTLIDATGGRVEALLSRIDQARQTLLTEADEVAFSANERLELVRRYRPGTVEQLEQRLRVVAEERDEYRKRALASESDAAAAAQRLNTAEHERADLKRRAAEITNERAEIGKREAALRDASGAQARLEAALRELEVLKGIQRANALSDADARELSELRSQRSEWDRALSGRGPMDLLQQNRDLLARLRSLEAEVEVLPKLEARLQASIAAYSEGASAFKAVTLDHVSRVDQQIRDASDALRAPLESLRELVAAQVDQQVQDVRANAREMERRESESRKRLEEANHNLEKLRGRYAGIVDVEHRVAELEVWFTRDEEKYEKRRQAIEADLAQVETELADRQKVVADLWREARAEEMARDTARSEHDLLIAECERLRIQRDGLGPRVSTPELRRASIDSPEWRMCAEFLEPGKPLHDGEANWLDRVCSDIEKAGFLFERRLIEAFHTALKCSDIASLTVLAGVSGTGKSELPRQYGLAGGFRFLPVAVKPDWDAPQALWGHYDYLEGAFLPTELLQAWAQSQRAREASGFADGMLLLLLDEMNLARTELYLADLLSMLESRRGAGRVSVPIGLGAGCPAYELNLGRNVLLVGTMNEDETTHNLSDKVLDRGNVIRFARPTELISRQSFQNCEQRRWITQTQWDSWRRSVDDLEVDARQSIKRATFELNSALGSCGRAIGHRVYQAIETYVANHPRVISQKKKDGGLQAIEVFADQFEQRFVPKLRGIDGSSRGGRQCLEQMLAVLKRLSLDRQLRTLEASIENSSDGPFEWTDVNGA